MRDAPSERKERNDVCIRYHWPLATIAGGFPAFPGSCASWKTRDLCTRSVFVFFPGGPKDPAMFKFQTALFFSQCYCCCRFFVSSIIRSTRHCTKESCLLYCCIVCEVSRAFHLSITYSYTCILHASALCGRRDGLPAIAFVGEHDDHWTASQR